MFTTHANRITLALATIATVAFAGASVNAATIDDIESATGGTYLDFEFNTGGASGSGTDGVFTRNGLTATGTGSGWGFPDTSLAAGGGDGVNATGMDSHQNSDPEFSIVVSGLVASTQYNVDILALGNSNVGPNWGFRVGTSPGVLTAYNDIAATGLDITNNGVVSLYAQAIGEFTSSGSGTLTFYFDNPTSGDDSSHRALLDGLSISAVVPEPQSLGLAVLGLAGLGLAGLWRRRRQVSPIHD